MEKIISTLMIGLTAVAILSGYKSTDVKKTPVVNKNIEVSYINSNEKNLVDDSDFLNKNILLTKSNKVEDLTQNKINELLLIREEDKLVHYIYLGLGKKLGIKTFSNIAASEQTHMDLIKYLIDRHEIKNNC